MFYVLSIPACFWNMKYLQACNSCLIRLFIAFLQICCFVAIKASEILKFSRLKLAILFFVHEWFYYGVSVKLELCQPFSNFWSTFSKFYPSRLLILVCDFLWHITPFHFQPFINISAKFQQLLVQTFRRLIDIVCSSGCYSFSFAH